MRDNFYHTVAQPPRSPPHTIVKYFGSPSCFTPALHLRSHDSAAQAVAPGRFIVRTTVRRHRFDGFSINNRTRCKSCSCHNPIKSKSW
jgi:hypothetical protein